MQECKIELMMQGHEIWLENSKKDDANVELALVYGHNMRQDEIVPGRSWFSVGSDAEMQVFYEGSPLASADIKAVSKKEGKEMALVKTDSLGRARVPISTDGEWMFLVRHADPSKKVSDMFDESVFVSTLVMQAR
jgi:uncharacterized GH25 family protein